jgi:hypothetical protein
MPQDEAVEDGVGGFHVLGVGPRNGLELKAETSVGAVYDRYKRVFETHQYPSGQSNPEDVCQLVQYAWDGSQNPNGGGGYDVGRLTGVYYAPVNSAGNSCIAGTAVTSYQEWYEYWSDGQIMSRTLQMSRGGRRSTIAANYYYNSAGSNLVVNYPLATPFTQSGASLGTVSFLILTIPWGGRRRSWTIRIRGTGRRERNTMRPAV